MCMHPDWEFSCTLGPRLSEVTWSDCRHLGSCSTPGVPGCQDLPLLVSMAGRWLLAAMTRKSEVKRPSALLCAWVAVVPGCPGPLTANTGVH